MSLLQFLHQYHEATPVREPLIGYARNETELPIIAESTTQYRQYQRIERTTTTGYKMGWHRDHFLLRKFKTGFQFVPYDKEPPIHTSMIWYTHVDCVGAELILFPDKRITPKTGMYVIFDSNHVHKVTQQHSGTRCFILYKFLHP